MYTVKAQAVYPSNTIDTTEISLVEYQDNSGNAMPDADLNDKRNVLAAVHHKPTADKNTQKKKHHTVEMIDREVSKLK